MPLLHELVSEVRALREEVAELRGGDAAGANAGEPGKDWEEKPYYTMQEAADIWSVSYRTVITWRELGEFECIKRGRSYYIPFDDVERIWRRGVRKKR